MTKAAKIADQLIGVLDEVRHDLYCMDEAEVSHPVGEGKWTGKQIIGHLIDSALNNHQRIVRAQQSEHAFLPGYDQEFWVNANAYGDRTWDEIIVLWRKFNVFLADVIRKIPPAKMLNTLTINYEDPVTLEFVIEDYLRHVQHHLAQVRHLCK